jgi:putative spermidine/putrescine transport system ATP-binding protein/mannopine transport system ATP-binding protein
MRAVNLAKYFGPVRAVSDVSFEVEAGEFLALVGPSGSGKSTILMMIAGFETPSAGEVWIGGSPVTHVPAYRRDVGMVFQKYALFPHMTVWDNIAYPLRMRRVSRSEIAQAVEAALMTIRLEKLGGRFPHQLSGGQQQRVALARAIVYGPRVLLMDEPLGALDRKLRGQMQMEIKHLQKQLGATVIYVTHDQEEALTMADRVGVMNEGRLEQIGPPEELYETPVSSFVADFIGETNIFLGHIAVVEGTRCSVTVGAGVTIRGCWTSASGAREGALVRVAVRPERVSLVQPGTGLGYVGEIEEIVYAGASVAYIVRLASGQAVMGRLLNSGDVRRWKAGDSVEVAWRIEDAKILHA